VYLSTPTGRDCEQSGREDSERQQSTGKVTATHAEKHRQAGEREVVDKKVKKPQRAGKNTRTEGKKVESDDVEAGQSEMEDDTANSTANSEEAERAAAHGRNAEDISDLGRSRMQKTSATSEEAERAAAHGRNAEDISESGSDAEVAAKASEVPNNYEGMKKKQLLSLCKNRGVSHIGRKR
ncbi:hypothetical protein LTR60_001929, partial [Cryomyces antarcticus]